MKNIFLMQHGSYLNGHILVDQTGYVRYNENEFDILNFIFGNGIHTFEPIVIEYQLNKQDELSCRDQLISVIRELVNEYDLNPFLNVQNINEVIDIVGFCDKDYFVEHLKEYELLKVSLVDKENYLLGYDSKRDCDLDKIEQVIGETIKDGVISEDEILKIKDMVIESFNINKAEDTEWAKQQIDKAYKHGFIKTYHDSNEIITMGTLMTILNRFKDNT